MIQSAYEMLTQEPWCYTPEQIGKLTDWQIKHLYALPAAKRAEELRKDFPDRNGKPAPPRHTGPEPKPGTPEHRRMVISAFVNGPMGMSPERATQLYDSQLAAYRAQNGKG